MFAQWTPHFQPEAAGADATLQFPLWAQVKGLPKFLRTEEFLREVVSHFATVIYVENSDTYRARMLGLRVCIIPIEAHNLPDTIIITKIDGDGGVNHDVIYTGRPVQCERCYKKGHSARKYPKPRHSHRKNNRFYDCNQNLDLDVPLIEVELVIERKPKAEPPLEKGKQKIASKALWKPKIV
ncbi:hypothetical protein M758_UG055000 [Ceratodon purpureus]|nr:hypothetical protein M758_UG055000 [Ceratodon purpureus]